MSNAHNRDFIYTIPESVLFDEELRPIDLKVYMVIRSFMDTTGEAFPSNAWFADRLKIAPETASRSVARLEKRKHISRFDHNDKRYLRAGKPVPESLVSNQALDQKIKGGLTKRSNPVDQKINLLDQSTIPSKFIKKLNKKDSERDTAYKSSYVQKPMSPASHVLWTSERQEQERRAADLQSDPNDWREQMVMAQLAKLKTNYAAAQ